MYPRRRVLALSPTGHPKYYLDMGWPELMVSVEYDGDHHRTDRPQFARDIERSEYIARVGWLNIRVVVENSEADILRRVQEAWDLRRL